MSSISFVGIVGSRSPSSPINSAENCQVFSNLIDNMRTTLDATPECPNTTVGIRGGVE